MTDGGWDLPLAPAGAWVLAWETTPSRSVVPVGLPAPPGRPVTVGRRGDVPLGIEVVNEGISRVAISVTADPRGWAIEVANRNGAVLHPWGLASQRALADQVVRWPLVAVRIGGTEAHQQHWVLLEDDAYGAPEVAEDGLLGTRSTQLGSLPPPLAPAELAALQVTFADFLHWPPPTRPPQPRQLKQAAVRLGKSLSGVQDRLRSALDKALRLGLPSPTTLTNPDYLHVLVAAGYLRPPAAHRLYRRTVPPR